MKEGNYDSITGIEVTPEGKEPMKRIDFLRTEERVRILHDPVRLRILQILKEGIEDTITTESYDEKTKEKLIRQKVVSRGILSVYEILGRASDQDENDGITKNQIYHHLPILIEGGFVIKYGVITKGGRTTDYYRRTAENIVTFGLHYDPKSYKKAIYEETKQALPFFKLNLTDADREKFLNLIVDADVMRLKWANVVEDMIQGDITETKAVEMIEWLLWIYATGNEEYNRQIAQIRKMAFGTD